MSILDNYPGRKGNSGLSEFIINNIPYHERYFELFAGSAEVYRRKRPAQKNILCDANVEVADALREDFKDIRNIQIWDGLFEQAITHYKIEWTFDQARAGLSRKDFLYLDPPYPASSRRSETPIYTHEMLTDEEHADFLNVCIGIDANIMISTRQNDLYDIMLPGWRKKEFDTVDRAGPVKEIIYMNYPEPELLHQYDYWEMIARIDSV